MSDGVAPRRRKPRPTSPTSGWTIRYALGTYLATAASGVVIVAVLPRRELRVGVGGLAIDVWLVCCLIPLYRRRRFRARDVGLRGAPLARSVGLVVAAVVAVAIVNAIWLQGLLGLKQPGSLGVTLHESALEKVVTGFALAVSAPLTEEIFFRGVLYRALRNRLNVTRAALLGGVLFGLIHATTYPLDTLPPRMAFGVIACLLYERTGSLLPGIALHSLIDASGFEVAITGHNHVVFPSFAILGALLLTYAGLRHLYREAQARRDLRRMDRDELRALEPEPD